MEDIQSAFYAITNVILALVQLGICGYYFFKTRSTDGLLLVVASTIYLLTSIVVFVVMPILMRTSHMDTSNIGTAYAVTGGLGLIGTLVFLTGLFMLIRKVIGESTPHP